MRLLTWNVAGRVRDAGRQAAALTEAGADVVVLQEVRATAAGAWTQALQGAGYAAARASLPPGAPAADPARRLGVLIAVRGGTLEPLPSPVLPWPERHLAARVTLDRPGAEAVVVHGLHAPISSRADRVKVRTLEAVAAVLAAPGPAPVVLAGDLNTPEYESREGEVRSFARTRTGRLRGGFDERHDAAELALVPGLAEHGYVDAFRAVHGYGARDRSWIYPGRTHGFRLDHVFVRGAGVRDAAYVHAWREAGLSDHSALWADLALGAPPPG